MPKRDSAHRGPLSSVSKEHQAGAKNALAPNNEIEYHFLAMPSSRQTLPGSGSSAAFGLVSLRRPTNLQNNRPLGPASRNAEVEREFTAQHEAAFPLRTQMFDEEVSTFLLLNPYGTVVQIGGGVLHRFGRLDNGTANWVELRCGQCSVSVCGTEQGAGRVRTVNASIGQGGWARELEDTAGPYCFVLGSHPGCMEELDMDRVLSSLGREFPGAWMVLEMGAPSTTRVADEGQLIQLLLTQKSGHQSLGLVNRLRSLGAVVDRSRTLLDRADSWFASLPKRWRIVHRLFPSRLRARFSEYQILRVVMSS